MMVSRVNSSYSLNALLEGIVDPLPENDIEVSGISVDSRMISQGNLFIALIGAQSNAVNFIRDAIDRGAVAVLCESDLDEITKQFATKRNVDCLKVPDLRKNLGVIASRYNRYPSRHLEIVGVTGTDGKTSITHFVAQALHLLGHRCGIIGTVGNGLYGELHAASHTTPDSVLLHKLLADFSEQSKYVAVEVSSHGLDQYRVGGVEFDIAVLTNLSREHLDYHGSIDAYKKAKSRLFFDYPIKSAIVNQEEAFGRELAASLKGRNRVVCYGVEVEPHSACDDSLLGKNLTFTAEGFTMHVISSAGSAVLKSKLLGRFNASNLLAVIAVLLELKFEFKAIMKAVSNITSVNGRMQVLHETKGPTVVIDYAHTPNALQSVLMALRYHCRGQLWCVFGCGGDRDKGKRPLMGDIAARCADSVILTDDNPRTENAEAIVANIMQGMQTKKPYEIIHDRKLAIKNAICNAAAEDVVLIAGKGHEEYQIIGNKRIQLSDKSIALEVLKELQA